MKKIFNFMIVTLMLILCFGATCFAATDEDKIVKLIEVTDLDSPYDTSKTFDTSVKISDASKSHFLKLNWEKTDNNFYKVTIRTRVIYHEYAYDENTKATVNGNTVDTIVVDEDNNKYITFTYTYPKGTEAVAPDSSSLFHRIDVMYLSNGTILPNPIRVPHRKNVTVQIIPDEGYKVKDVRVDGESVGAVTEYTFKRVTETHKIKAYFEPIEGYVPGESGDGGVLLDKDSLALANRLFEFVEAYFNCIKMFR